MQRQNEARVEAATGNTEATNTRAQRSRPQHRRHVNEALGSRRHVKNNTTIHLIPLP